MSTQRTLPPLRSGGHLWGPRRVAAGIGIRALAEASGLNRGKLSLMESGRLIPTGAEFEAAMRGLERLEAAARP